MKEKTLTGTSAVQTSSRKISRQQKDHICPTFSMCSEVVGREQQRREQHNEEGLQGNVHPTDFPRVLEEGIEEELIIQRVLQYRKTFSLSGY